MGVENGYPLGEDIARVKEFYDRGARYLSLTHNGHNQLADSHTGERDGWKWNGVSPLGKQVVAEMNHFGIMVDVFARIESVDDANRGAIQSADHRIPFSGPRPLQREP